MKAMLKNMRGLEALGIRPDRGLILSTLSPTPLAIRTHRRGVCDRGQAWPRPRSRPRAEAPLPLGGSDCGTPARSARQVIAAALLSAALWPSPAAAVEPEKQPIYVNIMNGSLCGIDVSVVFLPPPAKSRLAFA